MLLGKIGDAAKKVNNEDSIKGVHPLNDQIKEILQQKHPKGQDAPPSACLQQNQPVFEAAMFEEIL